MSPTLRFIAPALTVAFLVAHQPVHAERCGGTERWSVKVGTDPRATEVDLTHPATKTVAEINALPQLRDNGPANDNEFRLDEETKVYTVHGFLALFKNEGDVDYHLVITDQSLRYSPGGPQSGGKETGTSFIAEIPNPSCVAGQSGGHSVHSAFEAALVSTREKFEQHFPDGKGADAFQGIAVTVTGVAFYDRQHRQIGRAANGLELHPLIDIEFGDSTAGPPVLAGSELLANPGFEDGSSGWNGSTGAIGEYLQEPAHGGK